MSSVTSENAEGRVALILATIKDPTNRATIERYLNERKASNMKGSTLAHNAHVLRELAASFDGKPFEQATRDDVARFAARTTRKRIWRNRSKDGSETITEKTVELNITTRSIHNIVVKAFFRWLFPQPDPTAYPSVVAWLKAGKPNGSKISVDSLLTPEDIQALLKAHPDPRERALLAVLYEAGLRAGEVCSLNVGSVELDEYGAVIFFPKHAKGLKTGTRRVRLLKTESVPYLHGWLEAHPYKDEPKAPLFFTMSHRAPQARFTPNSLYAFIKRAGRKAGLRKEINPHLFRHTSATNKARHGWNENDMRAYFGWTRSSDMPARYTHLAGQDYEDRLLEREGLKQPGDTARKGLQGVTCQVCKASNLGGSDFCSGCRNPLSPSAERVIVERQQEYIHESIAQLVFGRNDELSESLSEHVITRNDDLVEALAAKVLKRLQDEQK